MKFKVKPRLSQMKKMNDEELENYLNEMRRAHRVFANKKKYNRKRMKKAEW